MTDKKLHILMIEDDKVDQIAIKRFAANTELSFTYHLVNSIREAKKALGTNQYDIIVSDFFLGDGTTFEILELQLDIPLIVVTGTGSEEVAVEALKKGAYDYLIKDVEGYYLTMLAVTVENALQRFKAEKRLKEYQINLERQVEKRTAELEAEIEARRKAEEQIIASLKEKEILLHEVHHRVKNNMQVVISLLDLQAGGVKDTRVHDLLKETRNRVHAMASVHQILHESDNLSNINFKDYLLNLIQTVFVAYSVDPGRIRLKNKVYNAIVGINQATPVGLIFNELISNSLKHAFPDNRKGEIIVKMNKVRNRITLSVEDNGVGIPKTLDWRATNSLGLKLVRLLTEKQLGGAIEMNNSSGTKFIIKFCE